MEILFVNIIQNQVRFSFDIWKNSEYNSKHQSNPKTSGSMRILTKCNFFNTVVSMKESKYEKHREKRA